MRVIAILVLSIFLMSFNAEAGNKVIKKTYITNVNNQTNVNHNAFDYGAYGDVILAENKNSEWGVKTTYLHESSETRVLVGGKIYLNRLTWQKK